MELILCQIVTRHAGAHDLQVRGVAHIQAQHVHPLSFGSPRSGAPPPSTHTRPAPLARNPSYPNPQLHFAPSDFFEDELSADNFLRSSLATLVTLSEGHTLDEQASHFVGSVQQPANFPQVSQL